jgi:hypothetical protein
MGTSIVQVGKNPAKAMPCGSFYAALAGGSASTE